MPPLRDTVRLIDGDEVRRPPREQLGEAGHPQALGRNEEKVERAIEVRPAGGAQALARAAGVDRLRAEALRCQLAGLVVDQRDQRADHERCSAACDARKLIAE